MSHDAPLNRAVEQVGRTLRGERPAPEIAVFFDEPTFTASYLVADAGSGAAAVVDSVLGFDAASARTSTEAADAIVAAVAARGFKVEWLLETHAHADHLSAAPYLHQHLGGRIAIGCGIAAIQQMFGRIFNEGSEFARDGSQFDRLFGDGDAFRIGSIEAIALHVPGHTAADVAYVVGDAVLVGDTMFMPDYGTARADFPGGDARQLYRSIRRLMRLPDATRVFVCHDYKAPGREHYAWQTTMAAQRSFNVHVHEGIGEDEFVEMRNRRDATLDIPRLILPSVQVNMRAGRLPEPEANGTRYLKLPLDVL